MDERVLKARLNLTTEKVALPQSRALVLEAFESHENPQGQETVRKVVESVTHERSQKPLALTFGTNPLLLLATDRAGFPAGCAVASRGWQKVHSYQIHQDALKGLASDYQVAFLCVLAVLPEWRGKKGFEIESGKEVSVAEALVTGISAHLAADRIELLFASSRDAASARLFDRMGFLKIGASGEELRFAQILVTTGETELARLYFKDRQTRLSSNRR